MFVKPSSYQIKAEVDDLLIKIADYVHDYEVTSDLALKTAYWSLLDSLACILLALKEPQCVQLLGPILPDSKVPLGARVPGTRFELDPVKVAFDIGTCIRWLDYNDTWLGLEWGHPSDNLGGILAVSDYVNRVMKNEQDKSSLTVYDVLVAMVKAYEIQGVLALENAFNQMGLDHVILVKVATAAVVSKLLGFDKTQTMAVLSEVWLDGAPLRAYRHFPNTGPRKSWAAGDATSRAVSLAWLVKQGEPLYPRVLTTERWGFFDVFLQGKPIKLEGTLNNYVMENILFKVAYPAEFHAQTAIECAIQLFPLVKGKWEDIAKVELTTQASAMRIIHKEGLLYNYADRDHCLQYIVAVGLLCGELKPEYYSDQFAKDPRIDLLRSKMLVKEANTFSQDYLDPEKRSIANAVQVFFRDGTETDKVVVHYPLGHKRRRQEAEPFLKEKYFQAILGHYPAKQADILSRWWDNPKENLSLPVSQFIDYLV